MVQISREPPPKDIYKRAVEQFGTTRKFEAGLVFTFGNTIHSLYNLSPDLLVHETTHPERQLKYEGGPVAWWDEYFKDESFRLHEESVCYREQYKFICKKFKDRNTRDKFLRDLASELASDMYGNIIEQLEAMKLIKV